MYTNFVSPTVTKGLHCQNGIAKPVLYVTFDGLIHG